MARIVKRMDSQTCVLLDSCIEFRKGSHVGVQLLLNWDQSFTCNEKSKRLLGIRMNWFDEFGYRLLCVLEITPFNIRDSIFQTNLMYSRLSGDRVS